jgi:cell pole-organizing protein PopZ
MRSAPEGAGLVANPLQALQGEFLLRTGQREKGRAMLSDVAAKVRAAPGPDAWTQALFTLEGIARAARDAADWDVADWAARQMIEHDTNYAGGQYALALVARQRGDLVDARARFDRAAKLWTHADPDLPELRSIRTLLRDR